MVLAMQQLTGYRTRLALCSALLALACGGNISQDSDGGIEQSGMFATGGWSPISTGGAMAMTMAGTYGYTVGTGGGTVARATGGAPAVITTVASNCAGITELKVMGSLSISSGYVTTGILHGYGFTWIGDKSNANTCIVPVCGVTGCTPAFGATALCAAGVVAADATYNSVAGLGFNVNQSATGNEALPVSATAGISVGVVISASAGDFAMRVQVVDSTGTAYCVETGSWCIECPISITSFNTTCWDGRGATLTSGASIVSIHVIVPSDPFEDRPFSFCLTDASVW